MQPLGKVKKPCKYLPLLNRYSRITLFFLIGDYLLKVILKWYENGVNYDRL
jgi:hypothetical protein